MVPIHVGPEEAGQRVAPPEAMVSWRGRGRPARRGAWAAPAPSAAHRPIADRSGPGRRAFGGESWSPPRRSRRHHAGLTAGSPAGGTLGRVPEVRCARTYIYYLDGGAMRSTSPPCCPPWAVRPGLFGPALTHRTGDRSGARCGLMGARDAELQPGGHSPRRRLRPRQVPPAQRRRGDHLPGHLGTRPGAEHRVRPAARGRPGGGRRLHEHAWLTLGRGLQPQSISPTPGNRPGGAFRNVSAFPPGSEFDIHFRVVNAQTQASCWRASATSSGSACSACSQKRWV